jgi:hypothetical protein
MPVYVHGGADPQSPAAKRMLDVQQTLRSAGFKNVTVNFLDGSGPTDLPPLRLALDWFREMATPKKNPD